MEKSFDEDKKSEDKIDTYLDEARNVLESDLREKREMKFEIDNYVSSKLDEIVFFRSLIKDFSFPDNRVKDLTNMENEIYNQLLAYSELQKGNTKAEVALIGGFSSGKSTIINSFLKKEVCPSDPSPTTSSVTKFYFSDRESISLDGKKISPQQYADKVRHKNLGKDTKTYIFEYGHSADIFNSIVLYDTPGFGNVANKNDDIVTEKILKDVDVVIYTIVVDKGSLDQQDIEILKRLKKYKNKKIHCIINKSDLKSPQQIEKIKNKIKSFGIFDIIIAYSAKKVLNASKHFSIENFLESTKKKIYDKSIFESIVKGEEYDGRRNKKFYRIRLDDQEIDNDDIDAIIQRDKLEKIFNNISMQKHDIIHNNFLENENRYKLRAKSLLKDIVSEIDTYGYSGKNSELEEEYKKLMGEIFQFEKLRVKTMKIIIIKSYKNALSAVEASNNEKSYWIDPYYKIHLNKNNFDAKIIELRSVFNEIFNFADDKLLSIEKKYDISLKRLNIEDWKSTHLYLEIINFSELLGFDSMRNSYHNYYMNGYTMYYSNQSEALEQIREINKSIYEKFPIKLFISDEIYKINHDNIIRKSGMLQQDTQTTNKSKIAIKSKIKNYLKGEENA